MNMTVGNDQDIIWIVKIDGDSTYRLATEDITLSGNDYDGKVLNVSERGEAAVTRFQKEIDVTGGGGIGNLGSFSFRISRYNDNALTNDFFNDFYPATSQPYIVSRNVDVGIIWKGATTESQITWVRKGYIDTYSYTPRVISFDCFELSELESRDLPFYKVQKDFDNGVSYFLFAPEDNYGQSIPVIYGSYIFNTTTSSPNSSWISELYGLVPGILATEHSLNYMIASHKCKTTELALYKYINGFKTYMRTTKVGSVITNNNFYSLNFIDGVGQALGEIKILFKELSKNSTVIDVGAVTNKDKTDSKQLAGELIALRLGGSSSTKELGSLGSLISDVVMVWSGKMDSINDIVIGLRNNAVPTPLSTTATINNVPTVQNENTSNSFGTLSDVKKDTIFPWTIEEIQNLEYTFDTGINTGDAFYGYIHLSNIIVSGVGQ